MASIPGICIHLRPPGILHLFETVIVTKWVVDPDHAKVRPGYLGGSKLPPQASACPFINPQSTSQPAREGRAVPADNQGQH